MGKGTHVDELDLPDLLHQLHGGVAVDEEGLGVVSQLQRLQPLRHRRGVVAVVADRPHLQEGDVGQMFMFVEITRAPSGPVLHSHLCLFIIISTLLQISTVSFSIRVIISEHMLLCSADILLKSFLNLQICQD